MYSPPLFDIDDPATLTDFMRVQSFALLVTSTYGAPFASHIPLLLDVDEKSGSQHGRLLGHLAKANGQCQALDGNAEALVVFWGPHAYVSPTWYECEKMVPTWNYVTVHAYGKPKTLDDPAAAADVISRLTDVYESDATDNWSMDSLSDDFIQRQLKGITAFEIPVDRVEGKFKLSQNRKPEDAAGVIKGLTASGDAEAIEVAGLMASLRSSD